MSMPRYQYTHIFVGLSQVKESISRNCTFFAMIDYSENTEQILQTINIAIPNKTIKVLIQYPSPSIGGNNQYNNKCLFS